MPIIEWIVLGSVVGAIAAATINENGERRAMDILLGIAGSAVSGYLFVWLGNGLRAPDTFAMVEAVLGAIAVIFIRHAIAGGMASGKDA